MLFLFYVNVSRIRSRNRWSSQPLTIMAPWVFLSVEWSIHLVPPWVTAFSFLAENMEVQVKPTTFSSLLFSVFFCLFSSSYPPAIWSLWVLPTGVTLILFLFFIPMSAWIARVGVGGFASTPFFSLLTCLSSSLSLVLMYVDPALAGFRPLPNNNIYYKLPLNPTAGLARIMPLNKL